MQKDEKSGRDSSLPEIEFGHKGNLPWRMAYDWLMGLDDSRLRIVLALMAGYGLRPEEALLADASIFDFDGRLVEQYDSHPSVQHVLDTGRLGGFAFVSESLLDRCENTFPLFPKDRAPYLAMSLNHDLSRIAKQLVSVKNIPSVGPAHISILGRQIRQLKNEGDTLPFSKYSLQHFRNFHIHYSHELLGDVGLVAGLHGMERGEVRLILET